MKIAFVTDDGKTISQHFGRVLLVSLILFISLKTTAHAQDSGVVVHAVLFYSPTCGHCEFVISQTILPMMEEYGEQLQVVGVDVTTQEGNVLFTSALQTFNVEQAGVPFLVIDEKYLIGSVDIPEQFPTLVNTYLAQGGVDYPSIPGLAEALDLSSDEAPQATPMPASTLPASSLPITAPEIQLVESHDFHWTDRFAQDPAGNTLSVIVLMGMIVALGWVVMSFRRKQSTSSTRPPAWIIPLLCLIGFGVAGYLAYVETTQTSAICGPVGDCNTVQQSEYARLFGILPIGVLGLFGYVAIFISWLVAQYAKGKMGNMARISLFLLCLFGTFFSIYLTFLEPFVIGATCAWCLTSALLMTILMLLTVQPAITAFASPRLRRLVRY